MYLGFEGNRSQTVFLGHITKFKPESDYLLFLWS